MRCPECGHSNVPGSLFCERCGHDLPAVATTAAPADPVAPASQPATPLPAATAPAADDAPSRACQRCGHANTPRFRFCEACGAPLDPSQPAAGPAGAPEPTPPATDPPPTTEPTPAAEPTPAPPPDAGPPLPERRLETGPPPPLTLGPLPASQYENAGQLVTGPVRGKVKLVVEQGMVVGKEFLLNSDTVNVGREDPGEQVYPDIDLTGLDEGYVHRRHAVLTFEGSFLFVTHLGGHNRTYVNNRPIADHLAHPLNIGDSVRFGKVQLRLVEA